jgi:hypothetical protein
MKAGYLNKNPPVKKCFAGAGGEILRLPFVRFIMFPDKFISMFPMQFFNMF